MISQKSNMKYEFGDLLSRSLSILQKHIGVIIGGILFISFAPVLTLIPVIIELVSLAATNKEGLQPELLWPVMTHLGISMLFCMVLYYALRTGWIDICLKLASSQSAKFSDLFGSFDKALNFVLVHVLIGLAILIGLICLIVPAIFIGIKFAFAQYYVVDQNLGPIEALKKSWTATAGYGWDIFLAAIAFLVINIITSFIPLLGAVAQVVAVAYLDILICSMYRAQSGELPAEY